MDVKNRSSRRGVEEKEEMVVKQVWVLLTGVVFTFQQLFLVHREGEVLVGMCKRVTFAQPCGKVRLHMGWFFPSLVTGAVKKMFLFNV